MSPKTANSATRATSVTSTSSHTSGTLPYSSSHSHPHGPESLSPDASAPSAEKKTRRKRVTAEHTRQRVRDNQRRHRASKRALTESLEARVAALAAENDKLKARNAVLLRHLQTCGSHADVLQGELSEDFALDVGELSTEGLTSDGLSPVGLSADDLSAGLTTVTSVPFDATVSAPMPELPTLGLGAAGQAGELQSQTTSPLALVYRPQIRAADSFGDLDILAEEENVVEFPYDASLSTVPATSGISIASVAPSVSVTSTTHPFSLSLSPGFSSVLDPNLFASMDLSAFTQPALSIPPQMPILPVFASPFELSIASEAEFSRMVEQMLKSEPRPSCSQRTGCCSASSLETSISHVMQTPHHDTSGNVIGQGVTIVSCVLGPRCCMDGLPRVTEVEEGDVREGSRPEDYGLRMPAELAEAAVVQTGTTRCTQAVMLVTKMNFRGLGQEVIEAWLRDAFRQSPNGDGCQIVNRSLYSLLAQMQ